MKKLVQYKNNEHVSIVELSRLNKKFAFLSNDHQIIITNVDNAFKKSAEVTVLFSHIKD